MTPPPGAPALGSRLWLYTNFDCNLACDYCCTESSPRAPARRLPPEVARRACEEFAGLGGREILLTGGEPFLAPDLAEVVGAATRWLPVTILTNAMLLSRGSRRRTLDGLDPGRVTMQVSLDSGTPELHDRHRGRGSFDRARAGIELLRSLEFRVRVAATVDAADVAEEDSLNALLDSDGIPPEDRLIRRVARTGFADWGLELTLDALWPEPALTADGAWWHPVGIADPRMQVASAPLPLVTVLAVVRATLNDPARDRAAALDAFRCT
ncbi:MAG: Fe-S oxidoreductases of moaA/nifB/pqqE family [uncultured Solirubrobacteraceae bacterium]|uniref:Fe-S oxidoreductases of moaA/nifB/pqqE family n=1 Tax=uncultured Solirubrobacteraceae bacterium TaxID=1162706 RepID=A0A6J4RHN9_9ACTN|nr:MAG: Fe-S oxidoreductases of moaA/nifB/pqqE family [uncultured Solirubrobacteraceae bacterium]